MATKKITDERCTVEFRGVEFEISKKALRSVKVQKAMQAPDSPRDVYWALDMMCMGKSDEYFERMPDEDGEANAELGPDEDTLLEFVKAAVEAAAKN